MEQPIRAGGLSRRLTARRLLVAVPVAMVVVIGAAWLSTTVPPPVPGVPTVLVVGDSVPRRLEPALEREAEVRAMLGKPVRVRRGPATVRLTKPRGSAGVFREGAV